MMDEILDIFPHYVTVHIGSLGKREMVVKMELFDSDTVQDILDSVCEYARIIPGEASIIAGKRILKPEYTIRELRMPYNDVHLRAVPNPESRNLYYYQHEKDSGKLAEYAEYTSRRDRRGRRYAVSGDRH